MPPGKYLVTGNREARTVLTVFPKDAEGGSAGSLRMA